MPTARQRRITSELVDAQLAWSKHASCPVCHGKINLVINCPQGKALSMTLEAKGTAFRAMEMDKSPKEKTERGNR